MLCLTGLWGGKKQRSVRWRFGKQHVMVGGVTTLPACTVYMVWVDPMSPSIALCFHLCLLAWCCNAGMMAHRFSSHLIDQKPLPTAKFLMLSPWAEKCSESWSNTYFRKSVCLLGSDGPGPVGPHVAEKGLLRLIVLQPSTVYLNLYGDIKLC